MKQYPEYKVSCIKMIDKIPSHWEIRKISKLGRFSKGRGISRDEILPFGFPCIRYGEIYTDYDRVVYSPKSYINKESCQLSIKIQKGDVLFTGSGETFEDIGKSVVYYGDEDIYAGGDIIILKLTNGISPLFISYLMDSFFVKQQKALCGRGEIIVHIYQKQIREILIPLPYLREQNDIATFLDHKTRQINDLIAKKQRLIELLQEERTVIINQAVTKGLDPDVPMKDSGIEWLGEIPNNWVVKKLKYLAALKSGENITSELITNHGEYPVFGGNGIRGYFSLFTHDGDYVLIGRQGALCGNINYANGKFWASEHAVVASLFKETDITWFGELLRSMNLNTYSQSAAQPGLSVEMIKNLSIPVPSIKGQNHISLYINESTKRINNTIIQITKEIALIKEYKTALINEAVTGKIDVRDHPINHASLHSQ